MEHQYQLQQQPSAGHPGDPSGAPPFAPGAPFLDPSLVSPPPPPLDPGHFDPEALSLQFHGPPNPFYISARHLNSAEPDYSASKHLDNWRLRERIRTAGAALVVCLNIGVDPPDVLRTTPCARLQCWTDPFDATPPKALEKIGKALNLQYERLQPKAKYKLCMDSTIEDVRKVCLQLRKGFREDRLLFHYNGHGVPRPTQNGELWVYNRDFTQYIPVSLYDIQTWLCGPGPASSSASSSSGSGSLKGSSQGSGLAPGGGPAICVYDCPAAGYALTAWDNFAAQREREWENWQSQQSASSSLLPPPNLPVPVRDSLQLAACAFNEFLPTHPDLPADLFTSCLTTPVEMAVRFHVLQSETSSPIRGRRWPIDVVNRIPGRLTERKTPLGELSWILTSITDTIAWTTFPRVLYQRLYRQDLLVAALFRNYLLAERVMRAYGCTPMTSPALPLTFQHPLWRSWDLVLDQLLSQLNLAPPSPSTSLVCSSSYSAIPIPPHLSSGPVATIDNYVPSDFFANQLSAFEVWLSLGSDRRRPPEQLPILLQVLLSPVHRLRALQLLAQFLDVGPWAINLALSVGLFPYVSKLLQSSVPAAIQSVLMHIWTKLIAIDSACKLDMLKDNVFRPFLLVLCSGPSPSSGATGSDSGPPRTRERVEAAFVLASVSHDHTSGQQALLQLGVVANCLHLLDEQWYSRPMPVIRSRRASTPGAGGLLVPAGPSWPGAARGGTLSTPTPSPPGSAAAAAAAVLAVSGAPGLPLLAGSPVSTDTYVRASASGPGVSGLGSPMATGGPMSLASGLGYSGFPVVGLPPAGVAGGGLPPGGGMHEPPDVFSTEGLGVGYCDEDEWCSHDAGAADNTRFRLWLTLCLAEIWRRHQAAQWAAIRDNAHDKLKRLLLYSSLGPGAGGSGAGGYHRATVGGGAGGPGGLGGVGPGPGGAPAHGHPPTVPAEPSPTVRAAAAYALGCLILGLERTDHVAQIETQVATALLPAACYDSSPVVRREVVIALSVFVVQNERTMVSSAKASLDHQAICSAGTLAAQSAVSTSGGIYASVWEQLLILSCDPFPAVAYLAQVVVDFILTKARIPPSGGSTGDLTSAGAWEPGRGSVTGGAAGRASISGGGPGGAAAAAAAAASASAASGASAAAGGPGAAVGPSSGTSQTGSGGSSSGSSTTGSRPSSTFGLSSTSAVMRFMGLGGRTPADQGDRPSGSGSGGRPGHAGASGSSGISSGPDAGSGDLGTPQVTHRRRLEHSPLPLTSHFFDWCSEMFTTGPERRDTRKPNGPSAVALQWRRQRHLRLSVTLRGMYPPPPVWSLPPAARVPRPVGPSSGSPSSLDRLSLQGMALSASASTEALHSTGSLDSPGLGFGLPASAPVAGGSPGLAGLPLTPAGAPLLGSPPGARALLLPPPVILPPAHPTGIFSAGSSSSGGVGGPGGGPGDKAGSGGGRPSSTGDGGTLPRQRRRDRRTSGPSGGGPGGSGGPGGDGTLGSEDERSRWRLEDQVAMLDNNSGLLPGHSSNVYNLSHTGVATLTAAISGPMSDSMSFSSPGAPGTGHLAHGSAHGGLNASSGGPSGFVSQLLWHSVESQLVAADEHGCISVWDMNSNTKSNLFVNHSSLAMPHYSGLSRPVHNTQPVCDAFASLMPACFNPSSTSRRRVTALSFMNELDDANTLLMTGSSDGVVKIFADYANPRNVRCISAWRALSDISPHSSNNNSTSDLVFDWQQSTGLLNVAGNSSSIRVWDAAPASAAAAASAPPRVAASSITSDPNQPHSLVVGFADGSVRIFDRRCPSRSALIRELGRAHNGYVVTTHVPRVSNWGFGSVHHLVTGSNDGIVNVWDLRVANDGIVNVWDLRVAGGGGLTALTVHDRAPLLACGYEQQYIQVFTPDSQSVGSIRYHLGFLGQRLAPVSCLAFHPVHMTLAAGFIDSIISVYSPRT
ncbi:hypothetical protein, variant [Fonticula alba]|uniref:Raptor N-terminal CASPase-like domain-containing protein n=1 Tax=Fonticula alba TaxID=691883 RepID=A0A058Z7C1_FONAL|nr:hypothetical protein H696_03848 [Fonticula alba]XP_009495983.1 hypothetical protein, variant [Fonticula alba]KCV69417.1 hypothetical protein H696_03848 [Fonticula alba]KCV69418.1 hypothetical protein, variant [Fonticula alba]|eukprot:XP_009495982.1 hypothetical protein H696_03848 [Fonticula alba]